MLHKKHHRIILASLITGISLPIMANTNAIPLNQYGAVDVNATVPTSVQVPPAPLSFKAPILNNAATQWQESVPAQPSMEVKSYILMDAQTGNILASYNANKRIPPASLTKLMLLYIVEQQLHNGTLTLDTKLTVPTVAWATGGSRMFLKPKTEVSVKDLIQGVIIASGNDAAVTLAVGIAGTQSAFVDMMNITARKLGMTNTHFSDVMGLPAPDLYTSARDLSALARHVINDYPEYYHFFKEKYFTYNGVKQPNFNKLLFIDKYADGLKTGSTSAAGFSLIASENREGNRRLIAVVIGANNSLASAYDNFALLKYGNQFFTTQEFYKAGQKVTTNRVYMGENENIEVGTAKAVSLTYPKTINQADLKFTIHQNTPYKAPITKGQELGALNIIYKNKIIKTVPLVALTADPEGSMWQKMKGKMALWFA